jgi:2-methylisocitrate lyase-like PEP mutase family enzyme
LPPIQAEWLELPDDELDIRLLAWWIGAQTKQLRQLLAQSDMLTITGCHDALSAHLAEQAGFPAVFMSGFAVSVARLAMPDTGLISRWIKAATSPTLSLSPYSAMAIPVLAMP